MENTNDYLKLEFKKDTLKSTGYNVDLLSPVNYWSEYVVWLQNKLLAELNKTK